MKTSAMKTTLALVTAVMLGMATYLPAATVILPNGNRIDGSEIRAMRNGDVVLTTPSGQRTFARGTYAKAIADKPAAFDQARSLAGQGQHDQAISLLETIANEFRFLDWDNNALIAMAQIETGRGNHAKAVETYERLVNQSPELRDDSNVQWAYRDALLKSGNYDKLTPSLDQAIKSGSRTDAARAQVMRGDIRMAKGETEPAAMDYLRSAILFESEKSVQPEALLKAGQALDKLRDPRSKEMYRRLVENYPQSPQAQEARSRM
jgi:tetratricopeptide (TPR) repeat protein